MGETQGPPSTPLWATHITDVATRREVSWGTSARRLQVALSTGTWLQNLRGWWHGWL